MINVDPENMSVVLRDTGHEYRTRLKGNSDPALEHMKYKWAWSPKKPQGGRHSSSACWRWSSRNAYRRTEQTCLSLSPLTAVWNGDHAHSLTATPLPMEMESIRVRYYTCLSLFSWVQDSLINPAIIWTRNKPVINWGGVWDAPISPTSHTGGVGVFNRRLITMATELTLAP